VTGRQSEGEKGRRGEREKEQKGDIDFSSVHTLKGLNINNPG